MFEETDMYSQALVQQLSPTEFNNPDHANE